MGADVPVSGEAHTECAVSTSQYAGTVPRAPRRIYWLGDPKSGGGSCNVNLGSDHCCGSMVLSETEMSTSA